MTNDTNLPKLDFFVTDHSADKAETADPAALRRIYRSIKEAGVGSIRYDWSWRILEPRPGAFDSSAFGRYMRAAEMMKEAGLQPIVILSNIPLWALRLYKREKALFFEAYENYADQVRVSLEVLSQKGLRISKVQIFNELNVKFYTPLLSEDMIRIYRITLKVLSAYNPRIELMATLFAGNLPGILENFFKKIGINFRIATGIEEYLVENERMLRHFDVLAIDYYPGTWHIPLGEARKNKKEIFRQMRLLREAMAVIAGWGKKYEIGETGLSTNVPFLSRRRRERRQRYFYDLFFQELNYLLKDFRRLNLAGPEAMGIYELMDEPPKSIGGKILRALTPFPEYDFGLNYTDGSPKEILRSDPRAEDKDRQLPRLARLIKYLS